MAKLLIADDDPKTLAVLSRAFAPEYEIFMAGDGAEALAQARAHRPDIVLLDICMPEKDGVAVLKELAPEMQGTGFLMITGNDDEQVARECLKFGAFDYVTKPIDLEGIKAIIETRLRARK